MLLVSASLEPVAGFKLVDQATCKEIDWNLRIYKQRVNEFSLTDEWAYLWFKGSFETSDVGATYEVRLYHPDGSRFNPTAMKDGVFSYRRDYRGDIRVMEGGEVVGVIGVSITNNAARFYVNSTAVSVSYSFIAPNMGPSPFKPGEWRAEFTLDGRIAVSQRFSIGKTPPTTVIPTTVAPTTVTSPIVTETETRPGAAGLPSNLLLTGAVAVIVVLLGVYVYVRRKKPPSIVELATGEVSSSSMTGGERLG